VFDTVATAKGIYDQCDGMEVERTSNIMDLRYVPDNVSFPYPARCCTPHRPKSPLRIRRDIAYEVPAEYKPPSGYIQGLQHTRITCSWDLADNARAEVMMRKFADADWKEDDFKVFLASSSEEDTGSEGESDGDTEGVGAEERRRRKKGKIRNRYKGLLPVAGVEGEEKEDMEITFTPGLSELAKDAVERKSRAEDERDETVWQQTVRKKNEKRKEKKKEKKKEKTVEPSVEGAVVPDEEDEDHREKERFELSLLTLPDTYVPKSAGSDEVPAPKDKRKKKKKNTTRKEQQEAALSGFEVDVEDKRFGALFQSADFAIDPTHKNFKATPGAKALLQKRMQSREEGEHTRKRKGSDDLDSMIANIKKKAPRPLS